MQNANDQVLESQPSKEDALCKDEGALSTTHVEAKTEVPILETPKPYAVFTRTEQWTITWLIRCSMFFSSFTANMYFPCHEELQRAVGVNSSLINLTIMTYLIVQAIAPAFLEDLVDNLGRRLIYPCTLAIYVCANLGLALQTNYATLMVLRGLQSFGCSATVAMGYGVVADVATPATRGSMLGPAMIASNLGPSIGPLVGGVLAARAGRRWAFWLLVIVGSVFLAVLAVLVVFLPETGRTVVGNGSIAAPKWNRPLWRAQKQRQVRSPEEERIWKKRDLIPNPFKAVLLRLHRDTAAVLSMSAVYYATCYCIQASIPASFADIYGLDELQVRLCYFSIGTGVILGGYINGKMMDLNYRVTANASNITVDKVFGDDLANFATEKVRTRVFLILILVSSAIIAGYGWILQAGLHISAPLVFLFIQGFLSTCICQTHNTLIVDISPENTSRAATAGNITRCALSAAAVAAMQPLLDLIGRGWFFTALAIFSGVLGAASTYIIRANTGTT